MMGPELPGGTPSSSERPCERHGDVRDLTGQRIGVGPCVDRSGRVARHPAYVFPTSRNAMLRWCLVAAVLLASTMVGVYFVAAPAGSPAGGFALRSVLAPAPTISRHSLANLDCVQCHETGRQASVQDARCERCHDGPLSGRLSHAAHVYQGTGDAARALSSPPVPCVTCHVEHRGSDVRLGDVDDRECGSCHRQTPGGFTRVTSLARHPEFAIVRDGIESGTGLRWFNHALHVTKVQNKFQKGCEACHERPRDAAAFNPISFPAHCAPCHEADLSESAAALPAATVAALGDLPPPLGWRMDPDDPAQRRIAGITHADRWLLATVQALRASTNTDAIAAETTAVRSEIARLELRQAFGTPQPTYGAWTTLGSGLYAERVGRGDAPGGQDAVRAMAREIDAVASSLPDQDQAPLRDEARRLQQTTAPLLAPGAAVVPRDTRALRQLLDAVSARATAAGDAGMAARAAAMMARLDAISATAASFPAAGGVATPPGTSDALERLAASSDPRIRAEASRLAELSRVATRQAGGGIDPISFDLHRQETLRLLDATQQTLSARRRTGGGETAQVDAMLARVTALRRAVLAAGYGTPADTGRDAFFLQRQMERARIDAALDTAGQRSPAPPEPRDPRPDGSAVRLAALRLQLAALTAPSRLAAGLSPDDARRAIGALLGAEAEDTAANSASKNRCTLCHELTPARDQLMPLRSAGSSLLVKARFTHAPHVSADAANCETCHASIRSSTGARDVNLPSVTLCATCHASGKQAAKAAGCESCHRYHVSSARALAWIE